MGASGWWVVGLARGVRHEMHAQPARDPVVHLSRELPACGVDVVASRLADRRRHAGLDQGMLERADALARARPELGAGERIERNQVELARHVPRDRYELARVLGL